MRHRCGPPAGTRKLPKRPINQPSGPQILRDKLAPVLARRRHFMLARRYRVRRGGRLDLSWMSRVSRMRKRYAKRGLAVLS